MTGPDEEARASAYRAQTEARALVIDAREKALAGSDAARQALQDHNAAFTQAGEELAPKGEYDGKYPDQRA